MRVLVLTRHSWKGATSRIRHLDHLAFFESRGIAIVSQAFFGDWYLSQKYAGKRISLFAVLRAYAERIRILMKARQFDAVWIEKEALPFAPVAFERLLLPMNRTIFDFNDSWHERYKREYGLLIGKLLGNKVSNLVKVSFAITVPNDHLYDEFHNLAKCIVKLEGPIDMSKYDMPGPAILDGPLVVGWIGTPITARRYLAGIADELNEATANGEIELLLMGEGKAVPDLIAARFDWSPNAEAEFISRCHVGIMPLKNEAFALGKSAYKALQYMAAARPVIASAVGSAVDVLADGRGFLVDSSNGSWIDAIRKVNKKRGELALMGELGKEYVRRTRSSDLYRKSLMALFCEASMVPGGTH